MEFTSDQAKDGSSLSSTGNSLVNLADRSGKNSNNNNNRQISLNLPERLNSPENFSAKSAASSSTNFIAQQHKGSSATGISLGPLNIKDPAPLKVVARDNRDQTLLGGGVDEFSSARNSAAGSDVDYDDVKSTGSSHPFSSPNPSEFDEHAPNPNFGGGQSSVNNPEMHSEYKRHYGPYKRRKHQQQMDLTGGSSSGGGMGSQGGSRLAYPLSERQQLALLMQMTAPDQHPDQPKSPGLATSSSSYQHHQQPGATKVRGKMARIFRRNDRGETALHLAAKRGDFQQCVELLREGAEVNVLDYAGWTPLHEACNKGWVETAELLINNGANVNACGLEDDTPLHDAALNGNKKLVILLLEHGADPYKSNASGKRPVDIVADDSQDIQELFFKYAGDGHHQQMTTGHQQVTTGHQRLTIRNEDHEIGSDNDAISGNDENMDHEIMKGENIASSAKELNDFPECISKSADLLLNQREDRHESSDQTKDDNTSDNLYIEEGYANETIVLSDTSTVECDNHNDLTKNESDYSNLNISADSEYGDNRLVVVEDDEQQQNCLKIVEPIVAANEDRPLFSDNNQSANATSSASLKETTPSSTTTSSSLCLTTEIDRHEKQITSSNSINSVDENAYKQYGHSQSIDHTQIRVKQTEKEIGQSQTTQPLPLPAKPDRPKRRLVPPVRPYDSALSPQLSTSPRVGRKRKTGGASSSQGYPHRHHRHGGSGGSGSHAHRRGSGSGIAKNLHPSAFYRHPASTLHATNQNQSSAKIGQSGMPDEKDVYEFHSSDSDMDDSNSTNSNTNNNNNNSSSGNAVAVAGMNRRKLVKLTEEFDQISVAEKQQQQMTSSLSGTNLISQLQDLDGTAAGSRDQSMTELKKSSEFIKKDTLTESPADLHRSVKLETSTKNAGDPNLHKSADEMSPRGRSISFTPNSAALLFPPIGGASSGHSTVATSMGHIFIGGGRGGATTGHVTTPGFPSSRKERLLGYRRKRGSSSHLHSRFLLKKSAHQQKFAFPINFGSTSIGSETSGPFSPHGVRKSDPDISAAWRRSSIGAGGGDSSLPDAAAPPPSSRHHVTPTNSSITSPKVPPLKLILSTSASRSSFSGQGGGGAGGVGGATDDESSLPSNPTYFVRNNSNSSKSQSAASVSLSAAMTSLSAADKTTDQEISALISAGISGSGGGSGTPGGGSGTSSPIVSEASQRITRSQVRLHGADIISRQIEAAAASQSAASAINQSAAAASAPAPVHPRKRKLKSATTNHNANSSASSKTIEPVAANRHSKPLLSTNLALMASKNPYEAQSELRKMIARKWQEAKEANNSIQYAAPKGYDKFLMSKKVYLLKSLEKQDKKNEEAMDTSKTSTSEENVPPFLRDLYVEQEKARELMKNRHQAERERLIIACETEALRVHNRLTRGTIDPPISAMRIIRDAEIYNTMQLDKPVPFSHSALSIERYTETTSINDVLTRFTRSKNQLIGRQRLEADCLFSTQFNEWETKCKSSRDFNSSNRLIEHDDQQQQYANFSCYSTRSSFPAVTVVTDFDLLPAELVA